MFYCSEKSIKNPYYVSQLFIYFKSTCCNPVESGGTIVDGRADDSKSWSVNNQLHQHRELGRFEVMGTRKKLWQNFNSNPIFHFISKCRLYSSIT